MRTIVAVAAIALWFLPAAALEQTADRIIERHLCASGGREALAKLTSRVVTGAIEITTAVGNLHGTVEMYNKRPNRSRTVITLDLSEFQREPATSDRRFDGTAGVRIDTINGPRTREITGEGLDVLRNASFPTGLLNYRETGFTVVSTGMEKIQGRDAHVIVLSPTKGPSIRIGIDAETYLLVRTSTTLNDAQLGRRVEQVLDYSDFRKVDGVMVPFLTVASNDAEVIRWTVATVKHNVELEDAMFSKPAGQ